MKKKKGFTLIELVMVMVIIGIMAGTTIPLLLKVVDSFQFILIRRELTQIAEVVHRRLDRDLRRLNNETSVFIATNTDYEMIARDGRAIRYIFTDTTLTREENGVIDTLSSNLSEFDIIYYDDAGDEITTPITAPSATDIKVIEISFTVSKNGHTLPIYMIVKPLNLKHQGEML